MKLTEDEIQERLELISLKLYARDLLTQEQFNRIQYLNSKEFHNSCSNPECEGYEGTEVETICPKCGSELFKLI